MLQLEDCIALSGLTEDEILALAQHEHLPLMAAAEMGAYLLRSADGERCIKSMIRDDILAAQAAGKRDRELSLKLLLRDFVAQHPCCDARRRQSRYVPERRALD
jgi:hypothetical protein